MPLPPRELLDGTSLFLDLDGTLLELADRPDRVRADAALRRLLDHLNRHLAGRLAIVSGRSLDQIDTILGSVAKGLAVSGSHGSEHRWPGGATRPERPCTIDEAAARIRPFAATRPGMLVEDKSLGVAIHYRMNPDLEGESLALADDLGRELGLAVQRGKMMVELHPFGADKGGAVRFHMLRAPMRGWRPLFIGDDLTDEPAFLAARELGGDAILIGRRCPTAANHGLSSPAALRAWLSGALR